MYHLIPQCCKGTYTIVSKSQGCPNTENLIKKIGNCATSMGSRQHATKTAQNATLNETRKKPWPAVHAVMPFFLYTERDRAFRGGGGKPTHKQKTPIFLLSYTCSSTAPFCQTNYYSWVYVPSFFCKRSYYLETFISCKQQFPTHLWGFYFIMEAPKLLRKTKLKTLMLHSTGTMKLSKTLRMGFILTWYIVQRMHPQVVQSHWIASVPF